MLRYNAKNRLCQNPSSMTARQYDKKTLYAKKAVILPSRHQLKTTASRIEIDIIRISRIITFSVILLVSFYTCTSSHRSISRISPKVFYLVEQSELNNFNGPKQNLLPFAFDEKHHSKLKDNTDRFETEDCKAMGPWQLEFHPTCNVVHEIGDSTKLLSSGSYRNTWLVEWHNTPLAFKTLVYEDEMSLRNLERHRRDAVVMSMLTSSAHIPNVYAHCADSGIFDYSSGNMDSIIRKVDESRRRTMWSPRTMLRYAWQVAVALKEVHTVGNNEHQSPAIVHTDIDTDQFLWIDGMFKLNDFNRARFTRWNIKTNSPCNFYIASAPGSARSPEEYLSHDYDLKNETLTPKIDVYSLGNIFYTILTKERVFRHESTKSAQENVKYGRFPSIDEATMSKFGSIQMSIYQAMKMCHILDFRARSSAVEVELFLRKEMEKFDVSFV